MYTPSLNLDCMNIFLDNGQKPPYSVILWTLEGQSLANVAQKWINSEHSLNECTHQVWFGLHEYFFRKWSETTIFSHFVVTLGPKLGQCQRWIISGHSLSKCISQIKIDWVISFPDNGQKAWTDGRTDGCMDGQMLTIPNSPPNFVGRDNKMHACHIRYTYTKQGYCNRNCECHRL